MAVLVTGAAGFLAKELIPRLLVKEHQVYGLYRKPPEAKISPGCEVLIGDILKPSLGLEKVPPDIDAIYHLAALLDLSENKRVWEVNYEGIKNVTAFAISYSIPHFYFVSSAYADENGRNPYERSKATAEFILKNSSIPKVSIIKPSIIIGSPEDPGPNQTINHVALKIARVHRKTETARRKVQSTLALPPLVLGFRVRGNPEATLNLIPVEVVAGEIANLEAEGTFFITNPNPPLLEEVADEVSEALGLNIQVVKEFRASPPEKILEKLLQPFLPYMLGEPPFPTIIDKGFKIPQGYISDMVRAFLG